MKIVGIMGSSRKKGTTAVLLDVGIEEAQKNGVEFSKISLIPGSCTILTKSRARNFLHGRFLL